ncbi:PP2C family protein-serine/threonine phosphatase [Streptomyces sp. CB01881]|uniref:PP2C family protein-serine/threonine phosphatase n=1 Tax=Streptomyces sp. CB01881 TaxID=2078691 RepID=UPI000CDC898A|nr:PP2C family protein-serine/threonine phosphatase [Streptomyces sp. CB01881]AUY52935.1 serine/threonine-protein phosphatase [Streptomyces sp. CB01881]TYC70651.1 serine/threonine-protein phosphatase [Streptomyces sp. CB01881]
MTTAGPQDAVPPLHLPRRTRLLLACAYLLLVVAVVADLVSGPGTTLSPVLAVAPVLAGATTRRARVVLITGAVATLAAGLLELSNRGLPGSVHVSALVTVLAATLASAGNVVLVSAREHELFQVRTVAEAAQRALLRPPPERLGPLRVAVRYVAAAAEARIGGDLYEVAEGPHGIRILLGDVQGHGLPAVETAADVLGVFREAARTEPELARVAERLDSALAGRPVNERFVTAVLLGVDGTGGAARLVNCGHPHPLLRRADRVGELEPPQHAPPLGLLGLLGGQYRAGGFEPRAGDLLLLYTDGVSEARNAAGRFFPLEERLAGLSAGNPEDVLDELLAEVRTWVGDDGLADDAALLALRWDR